MVRIRIGEGWASDPGVREGLAAPAAAQRRAAVRAIVDVLAVEVDGVDITAGRTEGPLASGLLALVRAVGRLAAGDAHASVPFEDGAVELVLHRRDGTVLLSVATLSRPSRLLAHDVEVDLPLLAEAAREAASGLCERMVAIAPGTATLPEIRSLVAAASRGARIAPRRGGPPSGRRSSRTRRRPRDAACSFEIHDEAGRLASFHGDGPDLASLLVPGRVAVRSPGGDEILSIAGSPYLLLRDLCAAAARIAAAPEEPISFDLARPGRRATARVSVTDGAIAVDDAPPVRCGALPFAQALVEGATDFCAVVRGRAASQARNLLLSELERSAEHVLAQLLELREGDRTSAARRRLRLGGERPSRRPIAPGRLRRVSFRRIAALDVGRPAGAALLPVDGAVVATGSERTLCLDVHTAAIRWRAPGADLAAASGGVVATLRAGVLEARDVATGALLWERTAPLEGAPDSRLAATGGRLLLASGPSIAALDLRRGTSLWEFSPPGAARLALLPLGPLVAVAADTGMVHALDPDGRLAWRLRGAGRLAAPPSPSPRGALLTFLTPTGGVVTAVDGATGQRIHDSPLHFTPEGPVCRFAGRLAVSGRVAGEGVVAALEEDGAPAWTGPSPAGPATVLAARPLGLLAKGPDGTCAALDREGVVTWVRTCDRSPAAPGNVPPLALRGLVVVPAEEVDLLDDATGSPVGRVPAHAPARIVVAPDLTTWTLDADGLLAGARVRGHLSVVDLPEEPGAPAGG